MAIPDEDADNPPTNRISYIFHALIRRASRKACRKDDMRSRGGGYVPPVPDRANLLGIVMYGLRIIYAIAYCNAARSIYIQSALFPSGRIATKAALEKYVMLPVLLPQPPRALWGTRS